MKRRVAVTGVGTISSAGMGNSSFVRALEQGRQCFSAIEDPRLEKATATHAGLVKGFQSNTEDPPEIKVLDRNFHFALFAMREALCDAGLEGSRLGPRAAVVMGTCSGGMLSIERHYESLQKKECALSEDLVFSKRYYTTPKVLAWAAGIEGPALTVVTACAAGSGALACGADLIRAGLVDIAVVGGSDTFAPSTLVGFDALKATCKGMCTPFSTNLGLNLGEGSAFLVLETLESAKKRGKKIEAEILGYGLSNDAYHPTAPDPSLKGQVAAMERAIVDAGITPPDVDYINAHGTGTRANDPIESRTIARVFGSRSREIPVSSTKSMIGHCLGAAGVLEASAVILSARRGILPPTAGFKGAREGCNLNDYVQDSGREWKGKVALSNSFGFGGNNASVVFDLNPETENEASDDPPFLGNPVVTGLGSVSPFGFGFESFANEDRSAIKKVERFELSDSIKAGLVPEIDFKKVDRRLDLRGMDLCSTYATLAARLALQSAGLKPKPREMESVGMVLGIATGPTKGENEHLGEVMRTNFALDRLGAFPYVVPNSVSGNVARALFLKGYNTVLAAGIGAGLAAAICSGIAISLGHADSILAISADELSTSSMLDGIEAGIWGGDTGISPGEGSAAFLIENPQKAANRGADILAEIVGYGMCTDCDDPREATGDALKRACFSALKMASLKEGDLQYVCETSVFGDSDSSLVRHIGLAEASLPLFNLAYLLGKAKTGANILAASLSKEGFANALILRKVEGLSG